MKINKTQSKKKLLIVGILLCVLIAGSYLGVAALNHLPPFVANEKTHQPGEQTTNLERSDTEKQSEQAIIDNPDLKTQNNQTDTPHQPTSSSSGKATVNVLVTNAGITNGTVSASGFVTNIVEEGGACTFTFTNGSTVISKVSPPLANATSTTCSTVRFPASELPVNGTWKVVLGYESSKAKGKSSEKEFIK